MYCSCSCKSANKVLNDRTQCCRDSFNDTCWLCPIGQVQALADLSTATTLRVLRIRRFQTLQVKARPALPRELTNLQQLAVLILDCDLHLRDVQVSLHELRRTRVPVLLLYCNSLSP